MYETLNCNFAQRSVRKLKVASVRTSDSYIKTLESEFVSARTKFEMTQVKTSYTSS